MSQPIIPEAAANTVQGIYDRAQDLASFPTFEDDGNVDILESFTAPWISSDISSEWHITAASIPARSRSARG